MQPPPWEKDPAFRSVLDNSLATAEGVYTSCRMRVMGLLEARLDPSICSTPLRREMGDILVLAAWRRHLRCTRAMEEKAKKLDYWAAIQRPVHDLFVQWLTASPELHAPGPLAPIQV